MNTNEKQFEYMLLARLQSDCEYFINKSPNEKHLHQLSVNAQITHMKELWTLLPEKPEWLSMEEINAFEIKMLELIN